MVYNCFVNTVYAYRAFLLPHTVPFPARSKRTERKKEKGHFLKTRVSLRSCFIPTEKKKDRRRRRRHLCGSWINVPGTRFLSGCRRRIPVRHSYSSRTHIHRRTLILRRLRSLFQRVNILFSERVSVAYFQWLIKACYFLTMDRANISFRYCKMMFR